MDDDRGDEDVRGPVVRLAHQEARLDVERDLDDRAVRLAHLRAAEGLDRPLVHDLVRARLVEEREVDAREHEHHERVERHLAEEERPVVGEHVPEELARERRDARALVDRADRSPDHRASALPVAPHHDGPGAAENGPAARSSPRGPIRRGSWGSGRPAGPKRTAPAAAGSNVE